MELQELDVVLFREVVPTRYNNRRTDTSKQSRSFSCDYHDYLLVFNYVLNAVSVGIFTINLPPQPKV